MKILQKLLLISMIVLTGCGVQEPLPLVSDNNYYINYEMKYYYGEEGETFTIDLEKEFFPEGKIVSTNNETLNLRDKYDSFELYVKLIDNKPVGYDYKIIDDFQAELTFLDSNYPLYCRLLNTKENKCSKAMLLGYTYVKQKDYIEVNSFEDLLIASSYSSDTISHKTFILNKDLDYNDYQGFQEKPLTLQYCTILNPNNYVIRNLDFKNEFIDKSYVRLSLFDGVVNSYIENLIFEDAKIDVDAYDYDPDPVLGGILRAGLLGHALHNSVIKDVKVLSLKINANYNQVRKAGGLACFSYNTAFINNYVNLDIKLTGEAKEEYGIPLVAAGGLAAVDYQVESDYQYDIENVLIPLNKPLKGVKRFPARYNKIYGTIQGVDVVGGLFGMTYNFKLREIEYNTMSAKLTSPTGNVGDIYGYYADRIR